MICEKNIIFVGVIASCKSLDEILIFNGFISVENGKITRCGPKEEFDSLDKRGELSKFKIVKLTQDQFLIPGFVDCHTHAPQFPNLGLGLDRPLLEWLAKYTYPLESQYKDAETAAKLYDQVVKRILYSGTTTACYFGSLYLDVTLELAKCVIKHGQRALVGKVSMNKKNAAGYFNDTKKEMEDIKKFIEVIHGYENELVIPILTPRSGMSCDEKLLTHIAQLSEKQGIRIQSHISENQKEVETILDMYPSCKSYTDLYDKYNILNEKCIMAHAIYLDDAEVDTFVKRRVSIAHCPASNTRLVSGLCPVNKYLKRDIDVGLGTDVSGGDSASILDMIRRTMDVSTHLELMGELDAMLSWRQAFYLATLGGAKALRLDKTIGSFEVGKSFDALLVDIHAKDSQIDRYPTYDHLPEAEYMTDLLQRFIYLGDDRNIVQVFVNGKKVKDIL